MRFAVFCLVALLAVAYVVARPEEGKYTDKYDDIDIDQILHSDRLLNNYYKCLMDKGSCAPDAAQLKEVLPDALETDCRKCTDKQKKVAEKAIKYLINNHREMWDSLVEKYDPENKYRTKFEERAKQAGINL